MTTINALTLAKISNIAYDQSANIKASCSSYGFHTFYFMGKESPAPAGFIAETDTDVVVCFRGTDCPCDLLTDLNATMSPNRLGGKVHDGFSDALHQFWPTLKIAVLQRRKPLWFCGHSLGGALATIATADCLAHNHPIAGLCTFGSPRCGNAAFANAFKTKCGNVSRYVYEHDFIPCMPPAIFGWRHVSKAIALGDQSWGLWSFTDHEVANYIQALEA